MKLILALFFMQSSIVDQIAESGRVVGLAESPSDRIAAQSQVAPGQPLLLAFDTLMASSGNGSVIWIWCWTMRVISAILVFAFFAAGQTELDQAVRPVPFRRVSVRADPSGGRAWQRSAECPRTSVTCTVTARVWVNAPRFRRPCFREYSTNKSEELKRLAGIGLAGCIDSQLKTEHPADADVLYRGRRAGTCACGMTR